MSKKKSLGHNPLAYSTRSHASFDFITPSNENEDQEEQKKAKVRKETASYYLESPIVSKVKATAREQDTSYSAIVNTILKTHFGQKK
ncbi:MAG: hypothetical protein RI564_04585 [Gracilimonas sp.]|jgi:hypothetical protein|nr:hypothetical protein [Gracilimonas sp.]